MQQTMLMSDQRCGRLGRWKAFHFVEGGSKKISGWCKCADNCLRSTGSLQEMAVLPPWTLGTLKWYTLLYPSSREVLVPSPKHSLALQATSNPLRLGVEPCFSSPWIPDISRRWHVLDTVHILSNHTPCKTDAISDAQP